MRRKEGWTRFDMRLPTPLYERLKRATEARSDATEGRTVSMAGYVRQAILDRLNREGDR